jgi:hypothetical protein
MELKETLHGYLTSQRTAVLWKLEGLSERELRTPMTATGTNLLGVVKHLAGVEAEDFGVCLGHKWPEPMPWWDDDAEPNADMWATADETSEQLVDLYRRVQAFADDAIKELPLEAPAHVPWWSEPETTLYRLLVHMIAETARHAGHVDIVRELLDGQTGYHAFAPNLPDVDRTWWDDYVTNLRGLAEDAGK